METRDYAKEVMAVIEVFDRSRKRKNRLEKLCGRHRQQPTIKNQYRDLIRSYEENKECQI